MTTSAHCNIELDLSRFSELAKLQKVILVLEDQLSDKDNEIYLLRSRGGDQIKRVQNGQLKELTEKLQATEAQLADKQGKLDRLRHAISVKERQRFQCSEEQRETIRRFECLIFSELPHGVVSTTQELQKELALCREQVAESARLRDEYIHRVRQLESRPELAPVSSLERLRASERALLTNIRIGALQRLLPPGGEQLGRPRSRRRP